MLSRAGIVRDKACPGLQRRMGVVLRLMAFSRDLGEGGSHYDWCQRHSFHATSTCQDFWFLTQAFESATASDPHRNRRNRNCTIKKLGDLFSLLDKIKICGHGRSALRII